MGIFGRLFGRASTTTGKQKPPPEARPARPGSEKMPARIYSDKDDAAEISEVQPGRPEFNRLPGGAKGHTGISIIDYSRVGDVMDAEEVGQFLAGEIAMFADSTHHESARYYPHEEAMEFTFEGGRRGKASPISLAEAQDYVSAASKGTWFWDNIRVRGTMQLRKNWEYT